MGNRARTAATALLLGVLAACTLPPAEPELPSLAEVAAASSTAASVAADTPGPPVTAACPLLSEDEMAQALNRPVSFAREDPGGSGPHGGTYTCTYGFGTGNAMLVVTVAPASDGSPRQVVERSVQTYNGVLETVTDLGDAAIYNNWTGTNWEYVTSAKAAGPEVRMVHLAAFLDGDLRPGLTELVGLALDRI